MTEPEPIPEDLELVKAKEAAAPPPEPVPDAEGLPADTKDGEVTDSAPPEADPTDPETHEAGEPE